MGTIKESEAVAVAWAALSAVAKKELVRESIPDGHERGVRIRIDADIEGFEYSREILGMLRCGQPTVKASSSTPDPDHLVAYLLVHIQKKLRDKLLRDLPEIFVASGETLPPVTPERLGQAKQLLERLRAKKTSTSAAPLTFPGYQLIAPTPGVSP